MLKKIAKVQHVYTNAKKNSPETQHGQTDCKMSRYLLLNNYKQQFVFKKSIFKSIPGISLFFAMLCSTAAGFNSHVIKCRSLVWK